MVRRTELKRTPLAKKSAKARSKPKRSPVGIGICEKCGGWGYRDGHHLLYQSQAPQLRDEPYNVMPLCRLCHDGAHLHRPEFEAWMEQHEPGRMDALRAMARERSKVMPR